MKRETGDWLDSYIEALNQERSTAELAGEADTPEEALLMRTARDLKYHARPERARPDESFVRRLEKRLLAEAQAQRPPSRWVWRPWRVRWVQGIAGAAVVTAAVLILVSLGRVPTAPERAAPAAAPRPEMAVAEAPAAAPIPAAAPRPAAGIAALAPSTFGRLAQEADVIVLGQVAEVRSAIPAPRIPPDPYDTQVVVMVERYLKGSLASSRLELYTTTAMHFAAGETVLVMARDADRDGRLEVLGQPQNKYLITPDGQAVATVGGQPPAADALVERLPLSELLARIEGVLRE